MPTHWRSPRYKLGGISDRIFTLLCLAAFGTPNLQSVWESSQDDDTFKEYKDSVIERVTTISVLVRTTFTPFVFRALIEPSWCEQGGLVLGSTAAFATTTPPLDNSLNYAPRAAYLLLLVSLGLTIGGLFIASAAIYIMFGAQRVWFRKVTVPNVSPCGY